MIITLRDYAGNEIDLDWPGNYRPVYLLRDEKMFCLQLGRGFTEKPTYWQVHIDVVTGVDPVAIRRVPAEEETITAPPADYVLDPDVADEPVDIDA